MSTYEARMDQTDGRIAVPYVPIIVTEQFDDLYQREVGPMTRLAFLLIGDRELAADVVHDAFVTTFERWGRIDRPGAYLRTSVVNRCRDQQRRRRFRATDSVAEVVTETSADPDDFLADVIGRLRPRQRAAIVLRYYLDLPEAEIAATLGVRAGTVKSLLSRGLDELRTALADRPSSQTPNPNTNPTPEELA